MRWILIVPMALVELVLLVVTWVIAFCHKPTGKRLVEWSIETLPDPDWYEGKKHNNSHSEQDNPEN